MTAIAINKGGRPPRHLALVTDEHDELTAIRAEGRASAGAALLLYIACAFAAVVCVGAVL